MRLWGRVRPGSLPLCQLSGLLGSQTLAFQWLLDALSSDHCRLGGGMRWGQGTINLPACVCVWGCVGEMGVVQDSCAVFLEARLGLRQRQKKGKNCSTRASFLPALGTLSRFQGAGAQTTTSDCRRLFSHTSVDSVETSSSITYFKSG